MNALCSIALLLLLFYLPYVASTCLVQFIEHYLSNKTMFVLYDKSSILAQYEEISNIQTPKILFNINEKGFLLPSPRDESNGNYIILVHHVTDLTNVLNTLSNRPQWNNDMSHLVVTNEGNEAVGKEILRLFWKYDIFDAVVAFSSSSSTSSSSSSSSSFDSSAFTWYPFKTQNKCGERMEIVRIDMCSNAFNPFEDKEPKTGYGCVLKAMWQFMPTIFHNSHQEFKGPGLVEMLLDSLEGATKLEIVLESAGSVDIYKEHFSNMKVTNFTNAVVDNGVDIIAGLYWFNILHQIGKI